MQSSLAEEMEPPLEIEHVLPATVLPHAPPSRWLSRRERIAEWMDEPGIDAAAHLQALRGVARLNWISGCVGRIWSRLHRVAKAQGLKRLTLIDVATGGGDLPIALARRARRSGIELEATGVDVSAQALEFARKKARTSGESVRFEKADVLKDGLPGRFDVAISSLFLHHLAEDEAVQVLRSMKGAAKRLALVNDLVRSPVCYAQVWLASRTVSRSPIVHFDGPASVRSAFSVDEALRLADEAGLDGAAATPIFPCRFLLAWSPPST